jgi:putative RecB family exonuclease
MKTHVAKADTSGLHISYSQISTYLACSLKYQFRYVLRLSQERIGLALPFGSALHKAIERYYRALGQGKVEKAETLQELFSEILTAELTEKGRLIVFSKEIPEEKSALAMGSAMLKAFCDSIDPAREQIVAVELALSAMLYTEDGAPTDFQLVGYIDLLVKNVQGQLIVVDHKTAARAKTQAEVDADLQMTAYAYLLAANRYVLATALVPCRFDVLRKLKNPKLEHYHTQRSADERKRLAKIAGRVLAGIDAGVFVPHRSWMCSDCEYANACSGWHR